MLATFALCFLICIKVNECQYASNWPSLDTRPLPQWYDDAKFGIFMHWGLFSVPSYGSSIEPETAWFWWYWKGEKEFPDEYFMKKNYRPDFTYPDFGEAFTSELFNATVFAEIVKRSGARYFVLTSKHHEGYTMWPSSYSWNWNAMDLGPHRDLVAEIAKAIRNTSIHFGLYYSLYEWFNPLYIKNKIDNFENQEYVQSVVTPQLHEIVNTYKPEIIWSDGDWEAPWQYWNSTEFISWLYDSSPVKDTVVTNDRWGIGTNCEHGDFYTCSDKFNPGYLIPHKWENCMTIDRLSWGYRRTARADDFLTVQELIAILASTISCGGNLLMNIGPTHDGWIEPILEERLMQMGQFVATNEEAIFGTKPWIYQNDTITPNIWYVSKMVDSAEQSPQRIYNPQIAGNTIVYAYILNWPQDSGTVKLGAPIGTPETKISVLGYPGDIQFTINPAGGITVDFSKIVWYQLPNTWSWVLKIENLDQDSRTPTMVEPKQLVDGKKLKTKKIAHL